jgi:hypothetical protein
MKNRKQSVFFGMVAIIALSFCFVGCDDKTDPVCECPIKAHLAVGETCNCGGKDCNCTLAPVPQTYPVTVNINGGGSVSIIIKYTALPNTVPDYMDDLEDVLNEIFPGVVTAREKTLTINVIANGIDGFVMAGEGSRTVNVRESWITGKTYQQIGESLFPLVGSWIT